MPVMPCARTALGDRLRFPRPSDLLRHSASDAAAVPPGKRGALWETLSGTAKRKASAENRELILAAFEASYEAIVRYVAIRTGERDQAEDLASEVFVKALKNAHTFKPDGKPIEAWLFRIAHNLVVDHHRRNSRRTSPVPLDNATDVASDDDALANVVRLDDIAALHEAMKVLTESEREVIALRFSGELTPTEIADALGKTAGAVRWLQHSAITKLRDRMKDVPSSDGKGGRDAFTRHQ